MECLRYAHENRCPWDKWTCADAKGVDCLRYAHERGCPWDKTTCERAAWFNGHIDCLKYAHEKGCFWDEKTCETAACCGRLECLKYAHEGGCAWDETTCEAAAETEYGEGGRLDCLKYAHENGCPWGDRTCRKVIMFGSVNTLRYVHERGCPFRKSVCTRAARFLMKHTDTSEEGGFHRLRYLVRNKLFSTEGLDERESMLVRAAEVLEAESDRAATVIQRRWLDWLYRPNSSSSRLRAVSRNFVALQES